MNNDTNKKGLRRMATLDDTENFHYSKENI